MVRFNNTETTRLGIIKEENIDDEGVSTDTEEESLDSISLNM